MLFRSSLQVKPAVGRFADDMRTILVDGAGWTGEVECPIQQVGMFFAHTSTASLGDFTLGLHEYR